MSAVTPQDFKFICNNVGFKFICWEFPYFPLCCAGGIITEWGRARCLFVFSTFRLLSSFRLIVFLSFCLIFPCVVPARLTGYWRHNGVCNRVGRARCPIMLSVLHQYSADAPLQYILEPNNLLLETHPPTKMES